MKRRDITRLIERLDAFEERAGVRIEALSAYLTIPEDEPDEPQLTVCGEVHARAGTALSEDIELTMSVHDLQGRVVSRATSYILAERFFAFDSIEFNVFDLPTADIATIRLVPRNTG